MKMLITLSLLVTTPVFAQDQLEAGLDVKQQKAMALIGLVNAKMNHTAQDEWSSATKKLRWTTRPYKFTLSV